MSQIDYYKCACKECGNNIEFPASAARTTIPCPHCGEWTELLVAKEEAGESEETGVRIGLIPLIGCVVLLAALIGGGILFWQHQQKSAADGKTDATSPVKVAAKPVTKTAPLPANSSPVPTQAVVQVAPKPQRPKSPDDLKAGAVELEKTKGSSLVYAVGTVKNDSDYDRYGVRIELDLVNLKGRKIGTAKDYKDFLGPNQEWQFRALIPDPKTVEAKVASVKEDQ